MGHLDDGLLLFIVDPLQKLHDLGSRLGVQVPDRLVREDDIGLVHQCPRDGHPLLLPSGELPGGVVPPVGEPHELQNLVEPFAVVLQLLAVQEEGEHHVLFQVQVGNQIIELKDEPDIAPPEQALFRVFHRGQLPALHAKGPRRRGIQPADQVEEGALAGAGWPHDGEELPLLDIQVNACEDFHLHLSENECLGEASRLDDRAVRFVHSGTPTRT
jgi:hypothetical protein